MVWRRSGTYFGGLFSRFFGVGRVVVDFGLALVTLGRTFAALGPSWAALGGHSAPKGSTRVPLHGATGRGVILDGDRRVLAGGAAGVLVYAIER